MQAWCPALTKAAAGFPCESTGDPLGPGAQAILRRTEYSVDPQALAGYEVLQLSFSKTVLYSRYSVEMAAIAATCCW